MAKINVNDANINKNYSKDSDGITTINGTTGNDSINIKLLNSDYDLILIDAKDGNDKISIDKLGGIDGYVDVCVIGGKGKDTIIDNDLVYDDDYGEINTANILSFEYEEGDGDDIVSLKSGDYDGDFNLIITSGMISNYKIAGKDHILEIGNGSIKLKNIKNFDKFLTDYEGYDDDDDYYPLVVPVSYYNKDSGKIDKVIAYVDGQEFNVPFIYNGSYEKYIGIHGANITIPNDGTEENDYICLYRRGIINAGAGNDYIIASTINNTIQYVPGDGDDTIYGVGRSDSGVRVLPEIQLTDDSDYAIVENGKDVFIKVKNSTDSTYNGSMLFKNARNGVSYRYNIIGGKLDTLNSFHYLKGTLGADRIKNTLSSMLINAYAGNDTIYTGSTSNVTVNAAEGNDYVYSYSSNSKLNLGAGKDTLIQNGGENVTIYAGAGDDVISLSSSAKNNIIQYGSGDGKDTIYNYSSSNTLQIAGEYSTSKSGSDIIISVGDGSVLLKNAGSATLNIVTVEAGSFHDDDTIPTEESVPSSAEKETLINSDPATYTANSTVITIDGSARTKKINITGNDKDNVITGGTKNDTINGGAGDDTISGGKGNDKLFGEAGNDVLEGGAGNDNLTGGAGNDVFVYASGDGKDVITDYTEGEDIIKVTSGTIKKVTTSKKGDVTFTIDKGSIKLTGAAGKKIEIVDDGGETLFNQVVGNKSITVTDSDTELMDLSIDAAILTIDGSTRNDDITLLANAKNNLIQLGTGNATVTTGKGKDTLIYAGGKLNITDYQSGKDVIQLKDSTITSATVEGGVVNFTTSKGTITVNGATNKKGKIQKITFADTLGSSFSFTAGSNAHTIVGSKKADTITGTSGNDYLKGGKGNDLFFYSAGNDTIADYSTAKNNSDEITLASGLVYAKHYITGKKKKDVLITFQNQSSETTTLTLLNAKGKIATINGTAYDLGDPTAKVFRKTDTTTTYSADSDVITIDASKHPTGLNITGNSNNNIIKGSSQSDTINGGTGNDTITTGKGSDLIIYTSGNDVITDYAAGQDKIQISDKLSNLTSSVDGKNVVLKVGSSGNLTLNKAKGKKISIVDSEGTATVLSGLASSSFEERWFLDNSECGIRNAELNSILDDKADIAVDYKFTEDNQFKQDFKFDSVSALAQNKK